MVDGVVVIEIAYGSRIELLEGQFGLYGRQGISHPQDEIDLFLVLGSPVEDGFPAVLLHKLRKQSRLENLSQDFPLQALEPKHLHQAGIVEKYLRRLEEFRSDIPAEGPHQFENVGVLKGEEVFLHRGYGYPGRVRYLGHVEHLSALGGKDLEKLVELVYVLDVR